jgi:hypothetical protein
MTQYYLDVEGNPQTLELYTIQYQKLDMNCVPVGDLIILKSWETSEEDIIRKFHKEGLQRMGTDSFFFVPVGHNLIFDVRFIFLKFKQYGLECPDLSEWYYYHPKIDTKDSYIISNNYAFKGSGMNLVARKKVDGSAVITFYANKEYDKIIEYIKDETSAYYESLYNINKLLKPLKEMNHL